MSTSIRFQSAQALRTYISAVGSMALMLFCLGIFMLFWYLAESIEAEFNEHLPITIELKNGANETDVFRYQKTLEASAFVKNESVKYVSKEEGIRLLEKDLGTDSLLFFGENPLPNTIQFHFKNDYIGQQEAVLTSIHEEEFVQAVFHEPLGGELIAHLKWLGSATFLLSMVFVFVGVVVIRHTFRLLLGEQRRLVQTMQVLGARYQALRKPYYKKALFGGIISSALASLGLLVAWTTFFSYLANGIGSEGIVIIICTVCVLGVATWWWMANRYTKRYLNKPVRDWDF